MKMTKQINDALTVVERYTTLRLALTDAKKALQQVSDLSMTNEMRTKVFEIREYLEEEIRNYSFRQAEKFIENNF